MIIKERDIIKLLFVFAIIVLCFLIITPIFIHKKLKEYTNHRDNQTLLSVPDLSNKTASEAKHILEEMNLKWIINPVSTYNPYFCKACLVTQDPFPGDSVKIGRTIYLTFNLEKIPQKIIPNYDDKSFRIVQELFKNKNLKIGDIFYKNDVAENVVLKLEKDGKKMNTGDSVPIFSKIDVYLGAGKGNKNEKLMKVPDLLGQPFKDKTGKKIQELIKANFFNVGKFELDEENVKDTTDFFVYKQNPPAGEVIPFLFINTGSKCPEIELFFTRGSKKITTLSNSIE